TVTSGMVIEVALRLAISCTCLEKPPLSASRSAASSMLESTSVIVGMERLLVKPLVEVVVSLPGLDGSSELAELLFAGCALVVTSAAFAVVAVNRPAGTAVRLMAAAISAALEMLSTMAFPVRCWTADLRIGSAIWRTGTKPLWQFPEQLHVLRCGFRAGR